MKDLPVYEGASVTISAPIYDQLTIKEAVREFCTDCEYTQPEIEDITERPEEDTEENTVSYKIVANTLLPLEEYKVFLKDSAHATIDIRNPYDEYSWESIQHYFISTEGSYQVYDEEDMEREIETYSASLWEYPQNFTKDEEFDTNISIAYYYIVQGRRKGMKSLDNEDSHWEDGEVMQIQEHWLSDSFNRLLQKDPIEFKKAIKSIFESLRRLQVIDDPGMKEITESSFITEDKLSF